LTNAKRQFSPYIGWQALCLPGINPLVCMAGKEYNGYENAIYHTGNYYVDKRRRERMNLIILLCIPLVPAIIVTIYAVVTNRKETKHTEPETA
jgi:hypothetical protein